MKELIDLLNEKEKRIISILCLLLAGALSFFLLISLPQKGSYLRVLPSLNSKEKIHDGLQEKTSQKKEEWLKWQEAQKDMDELRAKYFYSDKQGLEQLRLDLQQVFDEAGIPVSPLKFDYSEFKKESVRKVEVTFSLRGSYSALRKFVHAVEKFPRFLVIERIDFLNIGPSGEAFDLRVTLAGYYAS